MISDYGTMQAKHLCFNVQNSSIQAEKAPVMIGFTACGGISRSVSPSLHFTITPKHYGFAGAKVAPKKCACPWKSPLTCPNGLSTYSDATGR